MKKKVKSTFDPQKDYIWNQDDILPVTGIEFQILLNTLKDEVITPSGTSMVNKVDAYNILQGILIQGVESGIIKEK